MLEYATLGQIAQQAGNDVQDTSTNGLARLKDAINSHYATIARGHRWPGLLRVSEEKASTTSGQKYLYLPLEVEQVYLIFPQNGFPPLEGRDLDTLIEQWSINYNTIGETVAFAEAGEVGYMTDFYTTGETLTITTSSGSATTSGVVHGLVTSGEGVVDSVEKVEPVSITPGAGVTTSNTWKDLIAVSIDDVASGVVITVTGSSSGRVYARIAQGQRTAKYKRIRLMQPTTTSDLYTLVWKKRVMRLVDDNQSVEIPVGQVLLDLAKSTHLSAQREYSAAQLHYQAANIALEALKSSVSNDGAIVHQAIPAINMRRGYRFGQGARF
jgi:hypothetical protein